MPTEDEISEGFARGLLTKFIIGLSGIVVAVGGFALSRISSVESSLAASAGRIAVAESKIDAAYQALRILEELQRRTQDSVIRLEERCNKAQEQK